MNLEEYLAAVKTCPDDELRTQLGVTYDWPVVVTADYDAVNRELNASPKWRFNPVSSQESQDMLKNCGNSCVFDYVPGSVSLQVMSWLAPGAVNDKDEAALRERGYNMSIWVICPLDEDHPDIEGVSLPRACALEILDLVNFMREKRIPACFTHAPTEIGKLAADSTRLYYKPEVSS